MDYDHAHHAGNHADVLKHTALLALLTALKRRDVLFVETHAGGGDYALPPVGEWQGGWGRLAPAVPTGSGAVDRLAGRVRRLVGDDDRSYPGSPRLAADALRRRDQLVLHELVPEVAERLRSLHADDPRVRVVAGYGWAVLADPPAPEQGRALVVHIDPPFSSKPEWAQAAEGLAALVAARPEVTALLWYPVKRRSRPALLHRRLREAGVAFTASELLVEPLENKPDKLAGSGVIGVGVPERTWSALAAALPVLGPLLSKDGDYWEGRTVAWSPTP